MRADDFVELEVLTTIASAQALRSLLESEGVACLLDPSEPLGVALASGSRGVALLVRESELDRARSVLSDGGLSDQELASLAGEQPVNDVQPLHGVQEHRGRPPRPVLVALYAILCGAAIVLIIGLVAWSAVCEAAGWPVPRFKEGQSPLDVAASYGMWMPIELAWVAAVAIGLWRGKNWARYLMLATWIAESVLETVRDDPTLSASSLAIPTAIHVGSSVLLWWYLFRSRGCVAFFGAERARY